MTASALDTMDISHLANSPARSESPLRLADLLVVVGPSGAGKSTLIQKLMKEFPGRFGYSISHTTRDCRVGEVNGVSYHFVQPAEFQKILAEGQFLEHAVVHETMYGTSEASVRDVLQRNQVAMMDLDIVGAQNLRRHPTLRTVVIWVLPPSFEILEARLRERGTDPEEKIVKRMASARKEIQWHSENADFFDASLTNDNLEECYVEFRKAVLRECFDDAPSILGMSPDAGIELLR